MLSVEPHPSKFYNIYLQWKCDDHNGGVWKECEWYPLGQHKYFLESFEGEIALYRGRRKDYKPVLAKRYIVCIVLNGESGFQEDMKVESSYLHSKNLTLNFFICVIAFYYHCCLVFWII